VRLTQGPRENRFRPAIDPLFRTAAYAYGPRVVGVILTGALDDGTAGLWAVKDRGGVALVQEPDEAAYPSMPLSALRHVKVDQTLPVAEIAEAVVKLSRQEAKPDHPDVSQKLEIENQIALQRAGSPFDVIKLGPPSRYTCPECHGVLLEITDENFVRFRCHTGHAFSLESLLTELAVSIEDSLWAAVRAIQENVMLLDHLAMHADQADNEVLAKALRQRAKECLKRAELVRALATEETPILDEETVSVSNA